MQNLRPSPNNVPASGGGGRNVHKLWYAFVFIFLKYKFGCIFASTLNLLSHIVREGLQMKPKLFLILKSFVIAR